MLKETKRFGNEIKLCYLDQVIQLLFDLHIICIADTQRVLQSGCERFQAHPELFCLNQLVLQCCNLTLQFLFLFGMQSAVFSPLDGK